MALPPEELRQRIVAAAALRGHTLESLQDALGDYGAERQMASRIGRGERVPRPADLRVLAGLLEVPDEWFTIADVGQLLVGRDAQLETLRAELLVAISEARTELEGRLSHLEHDERGGADENN